MEGQTPGGGRDLPHLGLTIPLGRDLVGEMADLVDLTSNGYTDLWTAETAGSDAFAPLVLAAAGAPEARLGTAIASVFTRGPGVLARHAATLADLAPGRFALGLGASSPAIVEGWNAGSFERPVERVRDTVRFLRSALAGEKVTEDYDTFSIRGFRLERAPSLAPALLVAALRPTMLEMAGAEADGAILNWLSADDVTRVVPHVKEGRSPEAGEPEIVARIFVCPSEDADAVRDAARRLVSTYLSVPVYRGFHRWLGRTELEPMWDAWQAGDRKAATAAVTDSVVDQLIVHGTPAQCRAHIGRYVTAGVTTPVVKLLDLGLGRDLVADARALCPK